MQERAGRQKGVGLVIAFLLLLGVGASGLLLQDSASYLERLHKERQARGDRALRETKQALIYYMLLRAENDLNIAQGNVASVKPRWLMLPCPDNVSDNNLDGSQDASCRAAGSAGDVVNGILAGGSRFGRLPWRSRNINAVSHSLNDGIDIDVRDSEGNRPWYALSRNLAPSADDSGLPLNLHRLMTHREGWLTVVNHKGETIRNKIAAVVLTPGAADAPRWNESALATVVTLDHAREVNAANGRLAPQRYFEAYTVSAGALTVTNYNTDGVFIEPPRAEAGNYNDSLAYIGLENLVSDRRFFVRVYERLLGVTDVHNAPGENRPLANIAEALAAHHALFGFYPPPARQSTAGHLSQRQRHCAVYHSGASPHVATLTANTALLAPAPATVAAAGSTLPATVTLAGAAAFLLRQKAVAAVSAAAVEYNDTPLTVAALTLARYARLTLQNAVLEITAGTLSPLTATEFRVSAAAEAVLLSAVVVTVAPATPLAPQGDMLGWFAEHTLAHRRAGNDGNTFTLQADTRAMFWAPTILTSALSSVTVGSGDVLTLAAGSALRLEQDEHQLQDMAAAIFYQNGATASIQAAQPTPPSYRDRQFAVWLLADAVRRLTQTVTAPAVIFPWRQEESTGGADSRDNLHGYPPCFDARNFFGRRFQTAIQDQTMVYAVAEECHYGGDPAACGVSGGFTVSIAAGATVALPQALTLTHSYTATLGNLVTVELQNGVVRGGLDVTLRRQTRFPLLDAAGATLAAFQLSAQHRFVDGTPLVLPAQTALIGGDGVVFENVPALLIYSPAPLPLAACAVGSGAPPISGVLSAHTPPITVVNQLAEADDITNLCYWLDDNENADGDDFYVIYGEAPRPISPRNDYFILLGGQVRFG